MKPSIETTHIQYVCFLFKITPKKYDVVCLKRNGNDGFDIFIGVQMLDNPYWIPFGEQAVNVIYKLAEHPDIICGDIIKALAKEVIKAEKLNQTLSEGKVKQ